MRVPHAIDAVVEPAKARDYLLAPSHPVGGPKCVLFSKFGYSRSHWQRLATDLRRHVQTRRVVAEVLTSHGPKYVVRGSFRTRSGRVIDLVTVWIIRNGESFPRIVTAYPGGS